MTERGEIIPLFLVSTLSNLQSFHTFHTSFINIHNFHTSIINFQYFHTFHTFFYNKQGRLNVCYCLCVLNNQTPAHWKQRTLSKEVNIWNRIARALEHNAFQCVRLSKESFWKNSGRRFCFKERRPKNGKDWRHLLLSVGPHAPPLMALTSVFHFKKTERQARRPPHTIFWTPSLILQQNLWQKVFSEFLLDTWKPTLLWTSLLILKDFWYSKVSISSSYCDNGCAKNWNDIHVDNSMFYARH